MSKVKDIDTESRGLVKGRITVRPDAHALVIEVDDEQNPQLYVKVSIDREFLRCLLGSMDFKAREDVVFWADNEFREHMRRIKAELPDIPPSQPPLPDIPPGLI